MIPVPKYNEPADFSIKVRRKGDKFLKKHPAADVGEIRKRCYWKYVLNDLRTNYKNICAYSALWCPPKTGSVDHYKSIKQLVEEKERHLAYDWSNFRFSSQYINSCKRDSNIRDIVDPFEVGDSWFTMDFSSLIIKAGNHLDTALIEKIKSTIKILKLNEDIYIELRAKWIDDYCRICRSNIKAMAVAFKILKENAPFIASELERQHKKESILSMWKTKRLNQLTLA